MKTVKNVVSFHLLKFALQTFLSTAISHYVAELLKKSNRKLKLSH